MASVNYFDFSRKNLTHILKWKSIMEMHANEQFFGYIMAGTSCISMR